MYYRLSHWLLLQRSTALVALVLLASLVPQTGAHAQGGMLEKMRSIFGSPAPMPPRLVLVFVDISGSIKQDDLDIYQRTYYSIVGPAEGRVGDQTALRPGAQDGIGDKLVLGTISEATLTRFSPIVVGELRDTGRMIADKRRNEDTLRQLHAAFGKVKDAPRARRTLILDALTLAQGEITRDKARKPVIVLLSDMLEDSENAGFDFEKKAPTGADAEAIIKRQRERRLLPDLQSAQIFVAGASASTSTHMQAVKEFWLRYFKAANATVEPGMYDRSPIDFAAYWRQQR